MAMRKHYIVLILSLLATQSAMADLKDIAVLRLLDKVTAQPRTIEITVGETFAFKSLDIRVDRCDKTPPEDKPESGAFLKITEIRNDTNTSIFEGWMFASNPSINSLEHAVYDVWVVGCKSFAK